MGGSGGTGSKRKGLQGHLPKVLPVARGENERCAGSELNGATRNTISQGLEWQGLEWEVSRSK